MVGADRGGGYQPYLGCCEECGIAACACAHYQGVGIPDSVCVDLCGRQKDEFCLRKPSFEEGNVAVGYYSHLWTQAISDSISMNRKKAMNSDRIPQNQIGLCGMRLMAKKLDICTATAKQNEDA